MRGVLRPAQCPRGLGLGMFLRSQGQALRCSVLQSATSGIVQSVLGWRRAGSRTGDRHGHGDQGSENELMRSGRNLLVQMLAVAAAAMVPLVAAEAGA